MDYISLSLYSQQGLSFGVSKMERFFFFSSEDFSPPRSAFVCFLPASS